MPAAPADSNLDLSFPNAGLGDPEVGEGADRRGQLPPGGRSGASAAAGRSHGRAPVVPTGTAARKDIWTLVAEEKEREKKAAAAGGGEADTQGMETTVIFVGGKSSGKSTVVIRFLDRAETPSPTIGLEYTFGRRSRAANGVKDVAHIWELAGGTSLIDLASIPLAESNIHHSAVTLVLDLSKLNDIVPLVDTLLDKLAKEVNRILDSLEKRGSKRPKALRAHALKRFGPDHADLAGGGGGPGHLALFPVPAMIIGTKHDVFRDFDSEQRKVVCKYLRAVAHTHGASLVFFGLKDEPSVARTKGLLNHYAFRTNTPRGNVCQADHNKPLFVYSGPDSFAHIGPAPRPAPGKSPVAAWRDEMLRMFPPKVQQGSAPAGEDAAARSVSAGAKYPEPAVDAMRAQKDEELERYKKAAEKRAKEVAMLAAAGFAEGEGPKKAGKPYSRARAAGGLVAGVKG